MTTNDSCFQPAFRGKLNFVWTRTTTTREPTSEVPQHRRQAPTRYWHHTDLKIKLTPKQDDLVYAQSLSTPTNLDDDLLVELALMQEYGIISTPSYSKYSSPKFA